MSKALPLTFRATIIGLILGAALAAVGYLNDWALKLPFLANNLIVPGVIGLLLVGLLAVNPLVRLCRLRGLSGAEWAVVLAFMMAGAAIPGPGLGWHFGDMLVRHAMGINLSPEAMKAISQNLGHTDVLTTFTS